MRVLFITNIPAPYRVDFFNELGREIDLTVLYERYGADDRDSKWKSEQANNYKEIFLKGKNSGVDSAICLDILKWLKKDSFDIFVVGGYSTPTGMLAIQTLKMKNIPFILNSDGGFIKRDKWLVYKLKKYFISSATWWLSTGQETSSYLEYYGAKKEKIYIYPFSSIRENEILRTPLKIDERDLMRKQLGVTHNKVAISVGRYIYSKGYDLLINSWKNVGIEWELLIIGSGEEEENLKNQIKMMNLKNVRLIGFQQKKNLLQYYLASDIFILPTRSDVWGLVINEAIACGLPVVTTEKCIAGLEIINQAENGKIIGFNEFHKIEEIIEHMPLEEMSKRSIEIAKKYTIENMSLETIKIFNKIYNKGE